MLLIFDWDGTLADSQSHIVAALQQTNLQMSLDTVSDQDCANCIGLGLAETALRLHPGLQSAEVERFRQQYSDNYLALGRAQFQLSLFDGVRMTLAELQSAGHKLAVATGKSRQGLDRVLLESELQAHFSWTRAADETASKPDPTMLREILADSDFDVDDAIMIGDSSYDLEMASALSMRSVGVSYGVHNEAQLSRYNPIAIIDAITELPALIG